MALFFWEVAKQILMKLKLNHPMGSAQPRFFWDFQMQCCGLTADIILGLPVKPVAILPEVSEKAEPQEAKGLKGREFVPKWLPLSPVRV